MSKSDPVSEKTEENLNLVAPFGSPTKETLHATKEKNTTLITLIVVVGGLTLVALIAIATYFSTVLLLGSPISDTRFPAVSEQLKNSTVALTSVSATILNVISFVVGYFLRRSEKDNG